MQGGAGGRGRKHQSGSRERKAVCCEGSGCVASWTTPGQHEAELLRAEASPGLFLPMLSRVCTEMKKWQSMATQTGIFKHLYLTEKTDKPHTCQTLAAGVASFVVNIKRKANSQPCLGGEALAPRFTGTHLSAPGTVGLSSQGLFLDPTSDASCSLQPSIP